jgi:serine/threonine-protein kinase
LIYDKSNDKLRRPYLRIAALSHSDLPYVRADWFVATATRPPLYHELLQLPDNVRALESKLGVDLIANFKRGRLDRAGFARSEVSPQANRLVERQDSLYGAYWRSYDFRAGADNSQLSQFPLGPVFQGNPFLPLAFRQAGGEIIFNLPNGLQAYLLIDGAGKRLNEAPDFVVDPDLTSGSAAIVNGLSCMACHVQGMKTGFQDEIRLGAHVDGDAGSKVQQLYPEPAELNAKLADDRKRFLVAEQMVIASILKSDSGPKKAASGGSEPIAVINKYYRLDRLDAEVAAAELGLLDPETLVNDPRLNELGLGALAHGGDINRADWEKIVGQSLFQKAARVFNLGTPFHESSD